MARRKLEDNKTRKLMKIGNGSIIVTLPIEMIRDLGWKEGQKVTIKKRGEKLSIEDWKSKKGS